MNDPKIKKERIKRHLRCQACETNFISSRVDAKYCSTACKSYAHRRKKNPDLYKFKVPINIELSKDAFETLMAKAQSNNMETDEYLTFKLENSKLSDVELLLDQNSYSFLSVLFTDKLTVNQGWVKNLTKWIIAKANKEDYDTIKQDLALL